MFLIGCLIVVVVVVVKGGSEEQPLTIGTTQRVAVEMSDILPGMVSLRASSNDTKFLMGL